MGKQLRVQFAAAYSMADFQCSIDVMAAGAVEPRAMISTTIALDVLPQAFEELRGSSRQCKVMVDPWDD